MANVRFDGTEPTFAPIPLIVPEGYKTIEDHYNDALPLVFKDEEGNFQSSIFTDLKAVTFYPNLNTKADNKYEKESIEEHVFPLSDIVKLAEQGFFHSMCELRAVLSVDMSMWIAHEGLPEWNVPPHCVMSRVKKRAPLKTPDSQGAEVKHTTINPAVMHLETASNSSTSEIPQDNDTVMKTASASSSLVDNLKPSTSKTAPTVQLGELEVNHYAFNGVNFSVNVINNTEHKSEENASTKIPVEQVEVTLIKNRSGGFRSKFNDLQLFLIHLYERMEANPRFTFADKVIFEMLDIEEIPQTSETHKLSKNADVGKGIFYESPKKYFYCNKADLIEYIDVQRKKYRAPGGILAADKLEIYKNTQAPAQFTVIDNSEKRKRALEYSKQFKFDQAISYMPRAPQPRSATSVKKNISLLSAFSSTELRTGNKTDNASPNKRNIDEALSPPAPLSILFSPKIVNNSDIPGTPLTGTEAELSPLSNKKFKQEPAMSWTPVTPRKFSSFTANLFSSNASLITASPGAPPSPLTALSPSSSSSSPAVTTSTPLATNPFALGMQFNSSRNHIAKKLEISNAMKTVLEEQAHKVNDSNQRRELFRNAMNNIDGNSSPTSSLRSPSKPVK